MRLRDRGSRRPPFVVGEVSADPDAWAESGSLDEVVRRPRTGKRHGDSPASQIPRLLTRRRSKSPALRCRNEIRCVEEQSRPGRGPLKAGTPLSGGGEPRHRLVDAIRTHLGCPETGAGDVQDVTLSREKLGAALHGAL